MGQTAIDKMWQQYRQQQPEAPDTYAAWAFGDSEEMAEALAELVTEGKKTATASNYLLYELENEELPQVGQLNIILDGKGLPQAIVKTTSVTIVPFDEVTESHAFNEGEGDRSLGYWREVHEAFFKRELAPLGKDFHEKLLVVCEDFEVVYKKE
ncbi:ASCH domain-containing protein [Cytobacillus sp. Sa5YUA1]|uniref:ASCH domain-containing protein n=1 Tax=Cytobacillus stercorigallinarum TaxID=2762240 RepID=A0ABR8QTT1_9BACI|nr:ASCH domain-containing protein [Cytobacillus stercorigallinarum]MBD7938941.1 ASCH domain-containing protein [Cytobacillus stercorigallinarum]